jgi:predicted DNA-binding ribbon-helix-helix protein
MKSLIAKRSIMVMKRKTSITLEDDFWQALREIASLRRISLSRLISSIDADREFAANLSSAIRLFVLRFFKEEQARRHPTLEAAE